ncbi:DeoR/GlpR family DNA-binding transcription regulator [Novosphingobium piscinae]|uniref:DeoR/GlpR transcriptional regulator n=1 Tax=Novosphingobium piscinae TaxID=1507448 RepID=A0A7X1FVL5_9SPHN|nr:DeoR/GlpR family DNA-binding transcription regulator [Novosphingobium piscinae]MBC2667793.1 DeoR/GlpR transcriptional regulator [Novosphingobium piscinae]
MHAAERERLIVEALGPTGFVSYRELERLLQASPATIRRDLAKLEEAGRIVRVHGGAKRPEGSDPGPVLVGTPFSQSIQLNTAAKQAIGKAAAALVEPGEGIMIDGGTTTLQMCPHLAGLRCQVLTNSLHIVEALLPQEGTGLLVPSGSVFREQNIILAAAGEESMPRFHAPKLFMGAAAVGPQGIMQADVVLVAAERRLIERAEQVILLVDSSKFRTQSGTIVCGLERIDVLVTDAVPPELADILAAAGVKVVLALPAG